MLTIGDEYAIELEGGIKSFVQFHLYSRSDLTKLAGVLTYLKYILHQHIEIKLILPMHFILHLLNNLLDLVEN